MPVLDWSQCEAVESIPSKVSGAWVLRGTRIPVQVLFSNLEAGLTFDELTEQFAVSRHEVEVLMGFIARSLNTK